MIELELVGIHNDGEHLILMDTEGRRHQVLIDDALRAAVRRDRPQLEQLRSADMRPRDIQVMIRAGMTAEEVAEEGAMTIDQVRRYEGPVLAERAHVASQAQALEVGRDAGAPTLGELVIDRLAARGITEISWDARRTGSDPWHVVACYTADSSTEEATWQVDLSARTFHAMDEASRMLSEVDLADTASRRHLSAVPSTGFYDVETDGDISPVLQTIDSDLNHTPSEPLSHEDPEPAADTEAILAELAAARGIRQDLDGPHHDEPMLWDDSPQEYDGPGAPARASTQPEGAGDVVELPRSGPDTASAPAAPESESGAGVSAEDTMDAKPSRRRNRNRRTSVPSWDEIVFGAKND